MSTWQNPFQPLQPQDSNKTAVTKSNRPLPNWSTQSNPSVNSNISGVYGVYSGAVYTANPLPSKRQPTHPQVNIVSSSVDFFKNKKSMSSTLKANKPNPFQPKQQGDNRPSSSPYPSQTFFKNYKSVERSVPTNQSNLNGKSNQMNPTVQPNEKSTYWDKPTEQKQTHSNNPNAFKPSTKPNMNNMNSTTYKQSEKRLDQLPNNSLSPDSNFNKLSEEQLRVFDLITNQRKNVFFTGNAGSGKSFLLREIINYSKSRMSPDSIAITSSTGIAACNISGTTLHSFAGLGLAKGTFEQLSKSLQNNRRALYRWKETKLLIIDEISMVDGAFFDMLERIARHVKESPKPFGGIQLVLCGDFMQLPPVGKDKSVKFCFESESWNACVDISFQLKTVFRQKDENFVRILNEMRSGELSNNSICVLKSLDRPIKPDTYQIEPTELFSIREQVERANHLRLDALKGPKHVYNANDSKFHDQNDLKRIRDACIAPDQLVIKEGAQVMLIKNMPSGSLVNGSIGIVIGFTPNNLAFPIVRFDQGTEMVVEPVEWEIDVPSQNRVLIRSQVPLILAYAIAVSLDGVQLTGFAPHKVKAHPKVIEFYKNTMCTV